MLFASICVFSFCRPNPVRVLVRFVRRWSSLAGEILAIVEGSRVFKIIGDQQTQCEFKFLQLENAQIQREVVFVCQEGDWRAEG